MHWRRKWQPTPVFLPRESQGWGSLVGFRLWGRTESDTTERLHFHFALSYIEEGHGNPLQSFCLENPRDGGAWWASVCGVAQSWPRLKRLSGSGSSSSRMSKEGLKRKSNYQLLYLFFSCSVINFSLNSWLIQGSKAAQKDTMNLLGLLCFLECHCLLPHLKHFLVAPESLACLGCELPQ